MVAFSSHENRLWKIADAIALLLRGRTNASGDVTLRASQTTTVVEDLAVSAGDTVLFTPMTLTAAAEIGNGTIYVSSVGKGTFTLTHASAANTTRQFRYLVGGP